MAAAAGGAVAGAPAAVCGVSGPTPRRPSHTPPHSRPRTETTCPRTSPSAVRTSNSWCAWVQKGGHRAHADTHPCPSHPPPPSSTTTPPTPPERVEPAGKQVALFGLQPGSRRRRRGRGRGRPAPPAAVRRRAVHPVRAVDLAPIRLPRGTLFPGRPVQVGSVRRSRRGGRAVCTSACRRRCWEPV